MRSCYNRIEKFLRRDNFDGFTKDDLFIMNFMPKAWGHDIAALSNMAEALRNTKNDNAFGEQSRTLRSEKIFLIDRVVQFALHPKVNPWKKDIAKVTDFNHYGYYLEHLNIILGCYQDVADNKYLELNTRVTEYLREESLAQKNAHARLIPYVKMRWAADQAAIIYSLWLYDQNNATSYHIELKKRWVEYMETCGKHQETGMYITEVMGVKDYSNQPRGCSHAYMCYYMEHFEPQFAGEQWKLFKRHMLVRRLGFTGFREYLPDYNGRWTPDSGPIIFGIGIAATGLALKPLALWGDDDLCNAGQIFGNAQRISSVLRVVSKVPLLGTLALIGADMLATSILLCAVTVEQKYI